MTSFSTAANRDLLAMEFVLGLSDEADKGRISELLATDSDFNESVEKWRQHFSELDETAPATVTSDLWPRIEAAIERYTPAPEPEKATNGLQARFENLRSSVSFWRWSTLATTAAALALLAVIITIKPAQPVLVAVLTNEAGRPGAIVETFANGRVRLIPLQNIDVPSGRALQIWTLRDKVEGPISVGLVDKAKTIRLDLGNLPRPNPDQLFEITLEPRTGSPTNRPTGPVLFKGLTNPAL